MNRQNTNTHPTDRYRDTCSHNSHQARAIHIRLNEDQALIRDLLLDDPEAPDVFAHTWYGPLCIAIRRSASLSEQEVEDLTQNLFVKLANNGYALLARWRGLTENGPSLAAYLNTIARNLVRDYLRACAGKTHVDIDELFQDGDTLLYRDDSTRQNIKDEFAYVMSIATQSLESRDVQILELRFIRDMSYREISAAMGITVNHAGVLLNRTLGRLRERF